jgi:hypothetical protein
MGARTVLEPFDVGSYALVAAGADGLVVLDVRDPGSPALVADVPTTRAALAVAASGQYAYVGTDEDDQGFGHLAVIDIDCFLP